MQAEYILNFVREHCCNYDKHHQVCLSDDNSCKVFCGQRCGYFEKCVLGPVDYKYRLPGYDYQKLFAQYHDLTKSGSSGVVIQRRCSCGNPLQHRQRCCSECTERKRKESYRKYNRKRDVSTTTVN